MSTSNVPFLFSKGNDQPPLKTFIFSAIVALPGLLAGMSLNFPAISLNQLNFSMADISWYTSCTDFVAPIGILSQGIIVDAFGRKSAMLANIFPHIIGWFLIYCNFGVFVTILGRALTGMTTPSMYYAAQLYVVECITVNHTYLSNNFRTWTGLLSSIGVLVTFTLGSYFSYREIAIGAAVLSVCIFSIICIYIPESPTWLYLKGRTGDAEVAELRLHTVQPLLQHHEAITERRRPTCFKFTRYDVEETIKRLRCPEVSKAIITTTIFTTLIMFCGGTSLMAYISDIIKEGTDDIRNTSSTTSNSTSEDTIDTTSSLSLSLSLMAGFIVVLSHLFVTFTLPVLGIRILTIGSALVTCFGWILIGHTSLKMKSPLLHLVGIWITISGFFSGVLAAPISILSDLFPVDLKGAASIPILSLSFASALTLKMYPFVHAVIGVYLYYIYAFVCLILASFVYFRLPETVGRSYEQICQDLNCMQTNTNLLS